MDPDYGTVTNIAGVDLMVVECQDDHIWVETGDGGTGGGNVNTGWWVVVP